MAGQAESHRDRTDRCKELVVVEEEGAGQSGMVAELNVVAQNGVYWESSNDLVQSSDFGFCWRKRRRLRS